MTARTARSAWTRLRVEREHAVIAVCCRAPRSAACPDDANAQKGRYEYLIPTYIASTGRIDMWGETTTHHRARILLACSLRLDLSA